MRSPYVLTNKKLTDEEFKEKYYAYETGKQQFHTMDLSDGDNEKMQLLINNDRANRDYVKWAIDLMHEMSESSQNDRAKIRSRLDVMSYIAEAALALGVINCIAMGVIEFVVRRRS